jgi:hypothetical protein
MNLTYMTMAFFPNHKYLVWASEHPNCGGHLPDIFLDQVLERPAWLEGVANNVPGLCLGSAALLTILLRDVYVWGLVTNLQSLLILGKLIAENVTMIPSSYGYNTCMAYLHLNSPADDKFQPGIVNVPGTCSAMMWSGHTMHTMLGTFAVCTLLSRNWGASWLTTRLGGKWPEPRTLLTLASVAFIAPLLLIRRAHYTVDIFIATVVGMLILTHVGVREYIERAFLWEVAVTSCGTSRDDERYTYARTSELVLMPGEPVKSTQTATNLSDTSTCDTLSARSARDDVDEKEAVIPV